jgi:hypothetical protein
MALFRHPYLVRGVVHTIRGSFLISRGLVEAPEDVAEVCGWTPAGTNDEADATAIVSSPRSAPDQSK